MGKGTDKYTVGTVERFDQKNDMFKEVDVGSKFHWSRQEALGIEGPCGEGGADP